MSWLKRIALSLVASMVILLLLVWIAVGRLGSPALITYGVTYVPELSIKEIHGGLSSTLTIESLKYDTKSVNLTLQSAELELRWRCLFQFSVCADSIKLDGIDVSLSPSSSSEPEEPISEVITLPMLVAIDSLQVSNANIQLNDGTEVKLDTLETELRFYQRLRILSPRLDGLSVSLPKQQPSQTTAAENLPAGTKQDIQLNDVFLPINAEISQLQLLNASLNQQGVEQKLASLFFDASINGHQIQINQLQANHLSGTLEAEATANLSDDFPVDASVKISADLTDMPAVEADLRLSGSLQALQVNLISELPIITKLDARLKPLDSQLPIELLLNWEPFSDINLAPLTMPSTMVKEGFLSVSGNMEDYSVELSSSVTVPQLPSATAIKFNGLANKTRVDIQSLNISALAGIIESTGLVKLSDSIHWQLTTLISDVDGQTIDPNLPTNINGKLEYEGQIVNGKPNVNIRTIDINATQAGYPLALAGSGAYAGNAGVAVSNIRITHKQNSVQGFARMLIDRRVDADLIIAIEALGDSLPGYEGGIRGNILVMGDPISPNIEMAMDASSIAQVDEQGSRVEIAETASLNINGTNRNQVLTLDYVGELAEATFKSNIEIDDALWSATIEQASIKFKTINAEIEDVAAIRYNPKTGVAKIDSLCWEINTQGQACIDALEYQANETDFSIRIEDVFIDDWLKIATNALAISTPDAQFSALVSGSYSANNGLAANAEGEVTESDWHIGNREQSLMINIDPAGFKLSANKNLIQSEVIVTSSTIGGVEIRADFDAAPDRQSIDAEVIANKLLLAPFAYLSEDINKLDGIFDARLDIKGNISEPEITGSLQLQGGIVDIARAPSIITDWNAAVTFERFTADYTSDFKLGGGLGELTGSLNWRDDISLSAELMGNNFDIQYQDIDVTFSPEIAVSYTPSGLKANGTITIPKATIALQALPENAITPSRDVHLRGEPEPTSAIDLADIDLQILIDPTRESQVELDAFGLNANLAGQMRLTTQPTVQGFGDLQIINGQYRAYGQELMIRTGEVQFNGPLSQPLLFIEAIRDPQLTEDDVIAGLAIDGLASQPNIRLFSEPSMDQSQNLTYLLTGRGNLGGSQQDDNAFAGLLIGLGVSNSGGITGTMGEALGINDLRLSSKGSGGNTQVSVTGTIAPNLTLEYGVGLSDAVPEVRLRYKILPKLFVEATSGLEQSLVLYYEFAIGEVRQDLSSVIPHLD